MMIRFKILIWAALGIIALFNTGPVVMAQGVETIDSPGTLWAEANRLYSEGKYAEALELYNAILIPNGTSPEVLYNAGNAYAMLGKKGEAALMYERVLELNPRHENALHNLKLLAPADNFPEVFVLFRPIWYVQEQLTGAETVWLALGLYISGFFGLALVFVISIKSRKNLIRSASFACLGLAAILMIIIWNKLDNETNRPEAIILNNSVARSGPSEQNQSVLELPEALKVREKARPVGGWVEIQLLTGQTAFVPQDDIERI